MNVFLRMFSIETLIAAVVTYLSSTVKSPGSAKALQLRAIVHKLYKATGEFLERTGGIPQEF